MTDNKKLAASALAAARQSLLENQNQPASQKSAETQSCLASQKPEENHHSVAIRGRRRLEKYARQYNASESDLLDWYKDDLEILGDLTKEEFVLTVRDYTERREYYRG